ncbi:MAG: hypothetical protein ACTSVY_03970 [Candidatus Helarchaeota archaeon]
MLGKCRYFEHCSPNERLIQGNEEQYCIGAYELCYKFKRLESIKLQEKLNPYEKINKIVIAIAAEIQNILNRNLKIVIFDSEINLLHSDSSIRERELSFIKNYIRNNINDIKIGEKTVFSFEENVIGLFRIIPKANLIIIDSSGRKEDFSVLENQIIKYSEELKQAVDDFKDHLLVYHQFSLDSNSQSIVELFDSLKSKIEENITAMQIAEYMEKVRDKIALIFAWHPVLYEITIFSRERLKKYPAKKGIEKKDRKELINNIENWKNRLHTNI